MVPALLYSTLLYSTLRYSTLLYSALLYSTLLYSTRQCRPRGLLLKSELRAGGGGELVGP
eukprot:scaffold79865_cov38-Phaeocystis_antarctica.AAC.2